MEQAQQHKQCTEVFGISTNNSLFFIIIAVMITFVQVGSAVKIVDYNNTAGWLSFNVSLDNTTLNRDTQLIELQDSVSDYLHSYRFDGSGLTIYDDNITSNANGILKPWGWSTIAPPPQRRDQHGFEQLNGIIYLVAGMDVDSKVRNETYAYNISNNSWETKAPAPVSVQSPILRAVNGKLYLIGGYDSYRYYNTTYMYDPDGDNWTQKANMSVGREDMASAVVGDTIYIFGGIDAVVGHHITNITEAYNTTTNTWTNKSNMPNPRALGDYGASYNNKIYLVSGASNLSAYPTLYQDTTVDEYNPINDTWSTKSSIPIGIAYKEVERINDALYVIGGSVTANNNYNNFNYKYNITTDTWFQEQNLPFNGTGTGLASFGNVIYTSGGNTIGSYKFTYYPSIANMTTGKFGNALVFDGKKDYVDLGTFANKLLNGGTIIFFAKNWSTGTVIGRETGTANMGNGGFVLRTTGSGQAYFRINYTQATASNNDYRVQDITFHQYAISFDNTGRQYYRDGNIFGSKDTTNTQLPSNLANITLIGNSWTTFLNTTLDDLRIYDYVLTINQMKQISNGTMVDNGNISIWQQNAKVGNVINMIKIVYLFQNNINNASIYARQNGTTTWSLVQANATNDTWYNIPLQFNVMDFRVQLNSNGSTTPLFVRLEWDEQITVFNPKVAVGAAALGTAIVIAIFTMYRRRPGLFNHTIHVR